jgi:primosomal protein DnaI
VNLNIKLSEEQMMERQKNIARLKENEWIQIFLEQNHLDASFVEENSGVLLQWIKSVSACRNCKGLDYCVQKIRGKATKLKIDDSGFLNEYYASCQYEQKRDQQLAHQSKFRFSHMSLNDYLIDLNDACFLSAAKEKDYMAAYTQSVSSIPLNQGVYLYGNPGTGKSYLMKGICNSHCIVDFFYHSSNCFETTHVFSSTFRYS